MKVYYTCSTAEFFKYRDTYFAIRNLLINEGHVLTRDWLPHTEKLLLKGDIEIRDIKKIYADNITAIRKADLVIIEDTVSNFSTGHQITVALQLKKPTLVLWNGRKHRQFNQMFIHGIDSELLEVAEYNSENLVENIKLFIKQNAKVHEKNKFHLVLSNPERMYIDWVQLEKHQSRTKVIRDALRAKINEDKDYQQYLKNS